MKQIFSNIYVVLACRLLVGALFLTAAVPKIIDPAGFAINIDNYHFLPTFLVNIWAIGLPWVELLIGVILVIGPAINRPLDTLTEASALISALLYLSFIIALSAALARGLDIDCGCFATDGIGRINYWYLLRDSSLLAASLVVFFFHRRLDVRPSLDG